MTKNEMRIAIAEACWWESCHERNGKIVGYAPCETRIVQGSHGPTVSRTEPFTSEPPDYLNDLNAVREAFGTLSTGEKVMFVDHLRAIVCKAPTHFILEVASLLEATADQWAQAFLKVKGLLR